MRIARRDRPGALRLHAADPGADIGKMVQRVGRDLSRSGEPRRRVAGAVDRGAYRRDLVAARHDGAGPLTAFAASAPVSFLWFFGWRFLAGLSGGVIVVLAASVVLPHTSPARRGIVGGVIFAGVGLGIAASGTLVPLLLQLGLRESWYGLGALCALLTLISWTNWPKEHSASKTAPAAHRAPHSRQSHAVPGPARRIRPQCLRAGAAPAEKAR